MSGDADGKCNTTEHRLLKHPSPDDLTASKILAGITAESIPLPDTQFIRRVLENSRRAKSNKKNDPPRPPNAFFLFRNALHTHLSAHNLKVPQVSSAAGRLWDCAEEETKSQYTRLQEIAKVLHLEMHPGYVYRPRKSSLNAHQDGKKDEGRNVAQMREEIREVGKNEIENEVECIVEGAGERKGRRNSRKGMTARSCSQPNTTNFSMMNRVPLLSSPSSSTNSSLTSSAPSSPEKSSPKQRFNLHNNRENPTNLSSSFGSRVGDNTTMDNFSSRNPVDNFDSSVENKIDNNLRNDREKHMKFRARRELHPQNSEFSQEPLSLQPLSYNRSHSGSDILNRQYQPTAFKLQPTSPTTSFNFSSLNLSSPQSRPLPHMPFGYSLGGDGGGGLERKDNRRASMTAHLKPMTRREKVAKVGCDSNEIIYARPMILNNDGATSISRSSNPSPTPFEASAASTLHTLLPSSAVFPRSVHSSFLNHHPQIITFDQSQPDFSQLQGHQLHLPANDFSPQNSINMEVTQPFHYFYQHQPPSPHHRTHLVDHALTNTLNHEYDEDLVDGYDDEDIILEDCKNNFNNFQNSSHHPIYSAMSSSSSQSAAASVNVISTSKISSPIDSFPFINQRLPSDNSNIPDSTTFDSANSGGDKIGDERLSDPGELDLTNVSQASLLLTKPIEDRTKESYEHINTGENERGRDRRQNGGEECFEDEIGIHGDGEFLTVGATTTNRTGIYLNLMGCMQKQDYQQQRLHQAHPQYNQPQQTHQQDEQYSEWINWSENLQ
ncbi:9023_t:CDS:2 [Acaulospora colombiana]|uniref:9023_t:CDS:1 n=1 Tax=Acaulospora colombiana TaxID=27376 RepID=A0ACA9LCN7_9GLOM|nr:9023_t:CDS:2 [Acaulospora colombiana]